MKPDERSFRIALVADRYVNPPPDGLDALAVLATADWGAMQLPADDYPADIAARVLAEVTEQAFLTRSCRPMPRSCLTS